MSDQINQQNNLYYKKLIEKYGIESPKAVASGENAYKKERFSFLASELNKEEKKFSILEVGSGTGDFLQFLLNDQSLQEFEYTGLETVPEFLEISKKKFPGFNFLNLDISTQKIESSFDYVIFGGVFYHKFSFTDEQFFEFFKKLILNAASITNKTIIFNMVTQFVEYKKDDLYYTNLNDLVDFITNEVSRFFKIDHSTILYELTISIFKQTEIENRYSSKEFLKYKKGNK